MPTSNMFDTLHIADQLTKTKGAKTCLIIDQANKEPITLIPKKTLVAPFGINSYEESALRKNFEVRCNAFLEDYVTELDKWILSYVYVHSERLLKKKVTYTQVEEMYKSPLHRKEGYAPLLKTKVNTAGNHAVRFWDENGEMTTEPSEWKTTGIIPCLRLKSLWIMSGNVGVVLETTDVQVFPQEINCPFPRLKINDGEQE